MISIIVPVYCAEKYIEETVKSVLAQTREDWELLLVDDCSGDDTWQLLQKLRETDEKGRIRIFRQENNQGAARARNRGLAEAKGRYIAYLDADDLWCPDKLERQMAFLQEKQAAFTFTGYEFGDEQAVGTGKVVRVPERLTYRQALKNTTIFTSTVLFDTDRISKGNLEMPAVKSEDTALWWKILRPGMPGGAEYAFGLDENLVIYRRPAVSLSSNKVEAVRRIWNLYRRQEGLSLPYSLYNFCFWAVRAVRRRV